MTVDGKEISKVVPGLGRFIPADGSQSLKIMDYVGEPEKIVIDGIPAELKPYEPKSEPRVDTRTPEEKLAIGAPLTFSKTEKHWRVWASSAPWSSTWDCWLLSNMRISLSKLSMP